MASKGCWVSSKGFSGLKKDNGSQEMHSALEDTACSLHSYLFRGLARPKVAFVGCAVVYTRRGFPLAHKRMMNWTATFMKRRSVLPSHYFTLYTAIEELELSLEKAALFNFRAPRRNGFLIIEGGIRNHRSYNSNIRFWKKSGLPYVCLRFSLDHAVS